MKYFVLGAIAAYGLGAVVLFSSASLVYLPVPGRCCSKPPGSGFTRVRARASVARHAPRHDNPMPTSEENLIAGARIYRQLCSAVMESRRNQGSPYGDSFYPPAAAFAPGRTSYTDSEMFWIVSHGIRNTAMPAWETLLSMMTSGKL